MIYFIHRRTDIFKIHGGFVVSVMICWLFSCGELEYTSGFNFISIVLDGLGQVLTS
jgi:hypothetical protein